VYASGGGGAGGSLGGYTADGGGAEVVPWPDEVVGEPHVFWFFGVEGYGAGAIALDVLFDKAHGQCRGEVRRAGGDGMGRSEICL